MTLADRLNDAGARAVRGASRLRGERAFHPRGRAFRGTVVVDGGAGLGVALLDEPGTYAALVRVSRGVGLPPRLPDVGGLAVRLLDVGGPGAHQDLLVDTALPWPWLRRLPVPRREVLRATYSSLLPYEVGGRRVVLGARAAGADRATLDRLMTPWSLELVVADPPSARHWRRVAILTATAELPHDEGRRIRFTPGADAGGMVAAGPLQDWRRRSYPASHVAPDET